MDAEYYEPYAIAEERHWWFAARREIIRTVLKRLELSQSAAILEVGCASGGNLEMLREFGNVMACEYEKGIMELARSRHPEVPVEHCELPEKIPFGNERFDLIGLFDVIEHIPSDVESLRTLRGRLKRGGYLFVTVPAFQWLWSAHDEINHHVRRYTRAEMEARLQEAGLEPVKSSYFNLLLMPMILLARVVADALGKDPADQLKPPKPWVNGILEKIFASESRLVGIAGLPLGVSLLVVAQAREVGE